MQKRFSILLICFIAVAVVIEVSHAATPAQWQSRTIYQLLTDRFAKSTDTTAGCPNLSDYCGGTFQGIINHLDYIQGMGFDAIWISPIPTNTPGGYHGYWLENLNQINPHFGSANDLKNLVQACHQRGMYVMLDLVMNHVGPVSASSITPFNQNSYYHDCNGCDGCDISNYDCFQTNVQHCRLAGLPDLNQTVPYVRQTLISWAKNAIQTFGFDGLRLDTVPEVEPSFWSDFQNAVGVYTVGEVWSSVDCCVAYQKQSISATLSYPMWSTMRDVFQQGQSMYNLQNMVNQYKAFQNPNILGTFIDNHDNPRFLSGTSDYKLYENAIAYTLMSSGIPIIYYGTEQGFHGGSDPNCREALWPTGYSTSNPLYAFVKTVVAYRRQAQVWASPQVQRYADDSFYAFSRGKTFVAMTNVGSNGNQVQRTITYQPYADGTKICNIFYPTQDCITVQNGKFTIYLDGGETKIYHPM
eukprot:TRINITY_DN4146_c0_g1_i1.p1 TRINITY_DN4146_c0_g1~~TRINITY_DN4146_c0_g1_i1.p1  ORF type:complete len:469 (+),score=44.45 TRINITY_DN4146_c0_g1_i1:66-1472(+)